MLESLEGAKALAVSCTEWKGLIFREHYRQTAHSASQASYLEHVSPSPETEVRMN